jgi:hypothetical protein
LDLVAEFNNYTITSWKSGPDEWITTLNDLKTRINEAGGNKTDDDDILEHVMNNMPKDYDNLYTKYHSKIGALIDPLTIDGLKDEITLLFHLKRNLQGYPTLERHVETPRRNA